MNSDRFYGNTPHSPPSSLSSILQLIFSEDETSSTIGDLADKLDHHGMAVILILFSIPAALPIPAAGYSTVLSIPLLFIGLRLLVGKNTVWLPEAIRKREFRAKNFIKVSTKIIKIAKVVERFSKPRFVSLVNSVLARSFIGLLCCGLAAAMALPIPGTNTLPAGGIFLMGCGLLESDGFLTLGGILYSLVALALTGVIIFFGIEIIEMGIKQFKDVWL